MADMCHWCDGSGRDRDAPRCSPWEPCTVCDGTGDRPEQEFFEDCDEDLFWCECEGPVRQGEAWDG